MMATTTTAYPAKAASASTWNRRAADHESAKAALVTRLQLDADGYVDFVDTRRVTPDGEIVIVAVGKSAGERTAFYVNIAAATPAEVFAALAPRDEGVPDRLLEDHCERAALDNALSDQPRGLASRGVFGAPGPSPRSVFYEIYSDTCAADPFGCAYPHTFWTHWAMADPAVDVLAIEDLVLWPQGYAYIHNRLRRSLALNYYTPAGSGPLEVWIESGPGGFWPLIWSATFHEESFVWFRTGQLSVSNGGSHLHWSNLPDGNHVRLLGAWNA